jgi:hypothetical protein
MPQPRKTQVSLIDTPYYHCVSPYVRRSFLCGTDKYTGHSYEHRRAWVQERLLFLSSVSSIGICAYAVMSNHAHVVAYVDLNPIRTKMDTTSETSKHTSIQHRIQALIKGKQPKILMRFVGNPRQDMPKGMAYSMIDYCELVDCTVRCIQDNKAGYIEQHHSPVLARLDSEQWLTLTSEFEQHFSTAVGSEHMLQQFIHHTNHQRIRGMAKARVLLQHA